jgi:nucleoside-diphosphate-sugar epimerase
MGGIMDICLIGGTGNISSQCAMELAARGNRVTVVTRGNKPAPAECDHLQADRDDPGALRGVLEDRGFDVVINFLGFTREQCRIDYEIFRGRVGQYVFISSATVYHKPHEQLPVTEDTPLGNPFSQYAQNKILCEEYLQQVAGEGFPLTIVRPSHTFGKTWIPSPLNGSDYTVAARIRAGRPILVHEDGRTLWTLTAVSDFAAGLAGLIGNPKAIGEAFHITSDQVLTWNSIYLEIGRALGEKPRIVHIPARFLAGVYPVAGEKLLGDKAEHGVFDNTKIKTLVPDFECRKSFRTAIRESVAWYDEDERRKKINAEQDMLIDNLIDAWMEKCQRME